MTFLTASIAALVVLHIYYRIGVAITKADIIAKAFNVHLSTGKDYRTSSQPVGQYKGTWRVGSFGSKHPSNDRGDA